MGDVTKDWCVRMAALEGDSAISAGSPDHPLRVDETLATLRAQLAEANAKLAVVVGVLEKATTYVELCYSEEGGEEGEEARRDLAECNECIATLPDQAAKLMAVVKAARTIEKKGHDHWCHVHVEPSQCDCGHSELSRALTDYDKELT